MFDAYFDESGIHKGAEACIVAGYFGQRAAWTKLEVRWLATLRKFGVPLEQFHAKDAVKGNGFFSGWPETKLNKFLFAIADKIAGCRVYPACYGLFVDEFFGFSLNERRFLTGASWNGKRFLTSGCPNKPYFVAFVECLKIVTDHTRIGRSHFFFGIDRPASEYAAPLFRYLRARSRAVDREKLGDVAFPEAKKTPELQAADLFSYLSYKHMQERRASGDWGTPPSELILRLICNRLRPEDVGFRSAPLIKAMLAGVPGLT